MSENEEKDKEKSEKVAKAAFPTLSHIDSVEELGTQIGPYKLLSVLGEGGFGIVYRAEQKEPVRRQVALKIIKPGMDSKQVIGRFEAERQALALLDHPNIARIIDGGTTENGRPYFVMEYVKGKSLTEHCDRKKLNIEDRLRLFLQVCEAVQHAHQRGIIHRDIKPSNILVAVQEDMVTPKIIDFGVAKAISQPLTERTLFTEQGQLLGTPEYMSPEQADLTAHDVDTRSDIYSLGVVLYELLTSVLPFDPVKLREAAIGEILRTIRDDDPPSPSTRLSSLGDEADKAAQNRRTAVRTLTKRLHHELEWIPLKAMRKEPERRYRTATEFADDIRNYLDGDALIAGPESATYRLKKTIKRHRVVVTFVAAVLVVLAAGIVVSAIFAARALKAESAERSQRVALEQALKKAEDANNIAQNKREEAEQALEKEAIARVEAENAQKLAEKRAEEIHVASYLDKIRLADKELVDKNYYRAYQLLDACPVDLCGWEWHHLWHVLNSGGSFVEAGDVWSLSDPSFTQEGENILWAVRTKEGWFIQLFDLTKQVITNSIDLLDKGLAFVSFSPDGKRMACWCEADGTIQLLDMATQNPIRAVPGYSRLRSFPEVFFSHDGNKIATLNGGKVRLCNVVTGRLTDLGAHENYITSAAFSPDGMKIVTGSYDKTARLWDVETASELRMFDVHDGRVFSVAFSPNGQQIVTGDESGHIGIWDVADGKRVQWLTPGRKSIFDVAFSHDNRYIAAGDDTGRLIVYDVVTGEEIVIVLEADARSIEFSLDSRQVLTHELGHKKVCVWQVQPPNRMKTLNKADGWQMAITPCGTYLCSYRNNTVKVWNLDSDSEELTLTLEKTWTGALAFSRDGKHVAAATHDNNESMIHLWD